MSAPRANEPWENDPVHAACRQWISAWRHVVGDATRRPSWRFAEHLGRCAVGMAADGMTRTELQRLFAAAGYDGTCACGVAPDGVTPPAPEAAA